MQSSIKVIKTTHKRTQGQFETNNQHKSDKRNKPQRDRSYKRNLEYTF